MAIGLGRRHAQKRSPQRLRSSWLWEGRCIRGHRWSLATVAKTMRLCRNKPTSKRCIWNGHKRWTLKNLIWLANLLHLVLDINNHRKFPSGCDYVHYTSYCCGYRRVGSSDALMRHACHGTCNAHMSKKKLKKSYWSIKRMLLWSCNLRFFGGVVLRLLLLGIALKDFTLHSTLDILLYITPSVQRSVTCLGCGLSVYGFMCSTWMYKRDIIACKGFYVIFLVCETITGPSSGQETQY